MARRPTKTTAEPEVESYKHKEAKRKNIPTAELQKLVPDDDKAIKKLRWPRNADLDPQLVWRGNDLDQSVSLVVISQCAQIWSRTRSKSMRHRSTSRRK